jgi:hypothetical protein
MAALAEFASCTDVPVSAVSGPCWQETFQYDASIINLVALLVKRAGAGCNGGPLGHLTLI